MAFGEMWHSFCQRFFDKDRDFLVREVRLTIADPKCLLRKSKRAVVQAYAERYAKGCLVDLGCGSAGFQRFFDGRVSSYVRLDYPATQHSMGYGEANMDVAADVRAIPIQTDGVDSALLLDVLEHVFQVEEVLQDISRILRPGGTLLLTAPFIYPVHGKPYDFHRFSFYALERYLGRYDLEIVEPSVMGGYGTVLATLINLFVYRAFWGPRRLLHLVGLLLRPLLLLLFVFVNCTGYLLDRATVRAPTWVYLENAIICVKTSPGVKS